MQDVYAGQLAPPEEAGFDRLPDVIPDWVLSEVVRASPVWGEPTCDCCGSVHDDVAMPEPVEWATPGVTGLAAPDRSVPVSPGVRAVLEAVSRLEGQDPTLSSGPQALADAQALLQVEQRLRVLDLQRIGDVKARGLAEQAGFSSTTAWLRKQRPDGDADDASLAIKLRSFPLLSSAVREQGCSLRAARKIAGALRHCGPFLDTRDGLIDGQPGPAVLDAVIAHVAKVLCRELSGLHDGDPRLTAILQRATEIQQLRRDGASQATVLEAALTWLAEQVRPNALRPLLEEIVLCVLPSELEEREKSGQVRRSFSLTLNPDGSGWHACGDLTLECGERLWVALRAMAGGDPVNSEDTAAWEAARAAGEIDPQELLGPLGQALAAKGQLLPRAKRARLHDAFALLLEKFLDAGLGGTMGKAPVQIHVTLSEETIAGAPGASPAKVDSGAFIPRSVVRRWWHDSRVTAYVLSLGGKALRVVHAQRTLTADERRALLVEGGGRCAGEGCCPPVPDPLRPLRPHHVLGYAEDQITCLEETIGACDQLHGHIHVGKRTVQLRDGRWLNEQGWTTEPDPFDQPPF